MSRKIIFAVLILFIIFSCINAPYKGVSLLLQHLGTVLLLIPLMIDMSQKNVLDIKSYICLLIFISLHIVGARYLYSNVPYDIWIKKLFNLNIIINGDNIIHGNKYDRIVHFAFGLLFMPYFIHIAKCHLKTDRMIPTILFAWFMIQTVSMLYEIFEWGLSVMMSAEEADEYNGQQGDIWDAQKDMALALVGSSFSSLIVSISHICHKSHKK